MQLRKLLMNCFHIELSIANFTDFTSLYRNFICDLVLAHDELSLFVKTVLTGFVATKLTRFLSSFFAELTRVFLIVLRWYWIFESENLVVKIHIKLLIIDVYKVFFILVITRDAKIFPFVFGVHLLNYFESILNRTFYVICQTGHYGRFSH